MKRIGIIGTTKGGNEIFLSDVAWDEFISATHLNRLAKPAGLSIKIDMDRYILKGIFGSVDEIVTKLLECGIITKDPNAPTGISGDVTRVDAWMKIQEAEFDKKNAAAGGGK